MTEQTLHSRDGEAGAANRPEGHPAIALAVIMACQLMVGLDSTIVNIALPQIQTGLHFSATGLAWVFNAYTLAFGGLLLLGGRAGDILGRRRMFLAGVLVFTVASLLGGFATTSWWLVAARALQGVGGALATPNVLALIATNFPEGERRNRALSVFAAVSSASLTLGLIVGGILTAWVSWRWVLFVNVPIGIVIALLTPVHVRETERHPGRFDLAGAVLATLGVAGLAYAVIRTSSSGWTDPPTLTTFAASGVLIVLFVVRESRAQQPIMPLRLFRDRNRSAAYANTLLIPATVFAVIYFLVQFLQNGLGYGPLKAGFAFLPMTFAIVGAVRLMPRLLKRTGAMPPMIAGASLLATALLWLTRLSGTSEYLTAVLGPLLLVGAGAGLVTVSLSTTVLTGVAPEDSGAAAGLFQTLQWGSWSLGLAMLITVYESAAAHDTGKTTLAHASGAAFGAAAVSAMFGIVIAAGFIRNRRA